MSVNMVTQVPVRSVEEHLFLPAEVQASLFSKIHVIVFTYESFFRSYKKLQAV